VKKKTLVLPVAMATAIMFATAGAQAQHDDHKDAPVTKATAIHGAPGNTPGFGGSSANPAGTGNGFNGGAGIHNIGAAPGQGGANEADDRPAGNMHGGLAANTGYFK
jgi:hypothetical protein